MTGAAKAEFDTLLSRTKFAIICVGLALAMWYIHGGKEKKMNDIKEKPGEALCYIINVSDMYSFQPDNLLLLKKGLI